MARQVYTLSDETFMALSGFEAATAVEMGCHPSYGYQIKNGEVKDHFSPFFRMFCGNVRAGGNYQYWINRQLAYVITNSPTKVCISELSSKVIEKIQDDADALQAIVKSLQDNHLDESECYEILSKLAKKEATTAAIKKIVLNRLAEIKEGK